MRRLRARRPPPLPGKQSEVYTTDDSLDKVYAFYEGMYKEIAMRSGGPKLPSGQQVKWYFFILDSGTTLANSCLLYTSRCV